VDSYDVSASWWDQTLDRLELGISFQTPWFDGSIIMVQKRHIAEVDKGTLEVWNWLRPFAPEVWFVTVLTIVFSGVAFMWIEYLGGHRNDRHFWQWFSDNLYLSAISFPQNYEFQPRSAAGRLFGVSISLWALVMTATYTANLASLLVDTKIPLVVIDSIGERPS
jgi:Ligand-gated ion channel